MGPNLSDREWFRHHQQSASSDLFLGHPVKSRTNGDWITTVSRRFNHPDGSFAGVVVGTVSAKYFSRFYRDFNLGSKSAITLMRSDAIVMARYPDNGTYVGRDISSSTLFHDRSMQVVSGSRYSISPLDGLQRVSSFRRSVRFPIIALATMEQDEVLAPWRAAAAIRMLFVGGLTLLIAIIGGILVRELQSRQHLTSELAAEKADFRLLAEGSSDMVTRIGVDERLRYVSPSSATIVGWEPGQLTGTPALAGVNPEDLPRVGRVVAALKRGELTEARVAYRTRHRDAREVWLESTMRVTRTPGSGKVDGVVAISRDVTQQKSAEKKLAVLASLDGLTGIANRRRFDERFKEEWSRACRENTPLSLLMIDVDHFKKFNDRYGHQAGDRCLQSLAKALAREARRPADLAARYGGEEFVLLLPNTEAAGCEGIGEKLCETVLKLGLVHEANLPSGRVTISLGGATIWPTAQLPSGSSSLIKAADEALYAAKRNGRNRLVMARQGAAARMAVESVG
jgi:diguanylate cyclase (GGDEF)-like protein/PAS domain S-box-containing protein